MGHRPHRPRLPGAEAVGDEGDDGLSGDEIRDWVGFVATLLGIFGALIGFWKFRAELGAAREKRQAQEVERAERLDRERMEALRLSDVARWGEEAIATMQRVAVLAGGYPVDAARRDPEIAELGLRASELAEIGRLYFRNDTRDGYRAHKPPAYRGYRPLLLDYLILCHEVCRDWPGADADRRRQLAEVAQTAEQEFLSLLREEVGRTGTRVPATSKAGDGKVLAAALARMNERKSGPAHAR